MGPSAPVPHSTPAPVGASWCPSTHSLRDSVGAVTLDDGGGSATQLSVASAATMASSCDDLFAFAFGCHANAFISW